MKKSPYYRLWRDYKVEKTASRECREKKEVRDDSRWGNVCMCGNILVNVGITGQQSERVSEQTSMKKGHAMICGCITCGTECNECLRVFADHRQFIFGKGQPANDVLYKIVGDDWGHVPLQLAQYNQFPVLKDRERDNEEKMFVSSNSVSWHKPTQSELMGMLPCLHWPWNRSVRPCSQEMAL